MHGFHKLVRKLVKQKKSTPYIQCPKCSTNPITITPIWKWEFSYGAAAHYPYGVLQPYKKRSKILLAHERLQTVQKWMFIDRVSCKGDPL